MPTSRVRRLLSAMVDVLAPIAPIAPIAVGFAVAGWVAALPIAPKVKIVAAAVAILAGIVAGGRLYQRAWERRYPPVTFAFSRPRPAVDVVEQTIRRLGPHNHVILGVVPAEQGRDGTIWANISIKSDGTANVAERRVDLSLVGDHDDPRQLLRRLGVELPRGWHIQDWKSDEYAPAAAPPDGDTEEMVRFALAAAARLHEDHPSARWSLTFEG